MEANPKATAWKEHYSSGKGKYVCGMLGINIEPNIDPKWVNEKFEYLIADAYNPSVDIPDGFEVKTFHFPLP